MDKFTFNPEAFEHHRVMIRDQYNNGEITFLQYGKEVKRLMKFATKHSVSV